MARPAFKPTPTQRRTVAIAAGYGALSHEEIAIGLGVSRSTLERHFQSELSIGAYACRIHILTAMFRAAMKGSASAQQAFLAAGPRIAVVPAPKLGKKQTAEAEAIGAHSGTDWADLLSRPNKVR